MQRRMRVVTLRLYTARTPLEVLTHAHADAILALLMHKVLRAVKARVCICLAHFKAILPDASPQGRLPDWHET